MPDSNKPNQGTSPFEIVTSGKTKKSTSKGLLIAIAVVIFLILSVIAGIFLVRQQQDIRERAQTGSCPAIEACPDPASGELRNCHPPEIGNQPAVSTCDNRFVGRIEFCGTRNYCCNGTGWTTNMSACPTASPSPTATPTVRPTITPTATPAGTATSTSKATATPTPTKTSTPVAATAQATSQPIPVTGTGWPTYAGIGVGVIVIVASILLAL